VSRLGRIVVGYRFAVVALWAIAALASIAAFPRLSSVVNPDTSSFLPASEPSAAAARLGSAFQPVAGATATLVFSRSGGALTSTDLAAIATAEASVSKLPHVTGVRDDGVSKDGLAARAQVATDVPAHGAAAEDLTAGVRRTLASAGLPGGVSAHVTGKLATQADIAVHNKKADRRTEILTNLVVLVMLILVFRGVLAPIVTLLPAVLVLFGGGALIAELAQHGAFQVSSVANTLFTVLIVGAGTDYGLFLILRMREEMEDGHDAHEAVRRAVAKVGESIATSGGTVIGALLSLLLASFGLYYGLGPTLAIGIALLLLAGLTLLPALLAILGARVFWPRRIDPERRRESAWMRVGDWVVARPGLGLAAGGVFFAALALCALGFSSAGFGASSPPAGSDSAAGDAVLARHFPSTAENPTTVVLRFGRSVWSDLEPVAAAQRSLAGSSDFASVSGPLGSGAGQTTPARLEQLYATLGDPAALPAAEPAGTGLSAAQYEGYRALAQFVSADGRTVQLATALAAGPANSRAAKDAIPRVRTDASRAAAAGGATAVGVGGVAAVAHDISSVSGADLLRIVPIVLVLIGLLLAVVLRSLVAPLYLLLSVALSYFAALGLAVVLFVWVGGADGLNFVLPFLMFVFLMALGEDYNILVMTRIREESQRRPLREAVTTALHATGTSVTSAGLVLAATFAVAAVSGSTSQIRQLTTAISLGILMDTFLVRTLLVPTTVAVLGRWNWWPSRPGRASAADTP
jgi:putative drug exporter of the RND superfamily